jgi:hypothetical protein
MQAKTKGYGVRDPGDGGAAREYQTFTCAHCCFVADAYLKLPNGDRAHGYCHACMKEVCLPCGAKEVCDPFEKKLLRMERRAAFLRSVGMG